MNLTLAFPIANSWKSLSVTFTLRRSHCEKDYMHRSAANCRIFPLWFNSVTMYWSRSSQRGVRWIWRVEWRLTAQEGGKKYFCDTKWPFFSNIFTFLVKSWTTSTTSGLLKPNSVNQKNLYFYFKRSQTKMFGNYCYWAAVIGCMIQCVTCKTAKQPQWYTHCS